MGKKKTANTKIEDNDEVDNIIQDKEVESTKDVTMDEVEAGGKKDKGKKAKKGKRKGNDDEDLDVLMAELESEYTGIPVKPKEKEESKGGDDANSTTDEKVKDEVQVNGDDNSAEPEKGGKKGKDKKGKKNKRKNDDDDHDDFLTELESEYSGIPSKDKETVKPTDSNIDVVASNLEKLKIDDQENGDGDLEKGSKKDKGKKGKKSKRKGNDDEDLDDLMAELESEYMGGSAKPKEKKETKVSTEDTKEKELVNGEDDANKGTSELKEDKNDEKIQKDKVGKKDAKDSKEKDKKKKDAKSKAAQKEDEKRKKKLKDELQKEREKEEEESKTKKGKPNKKMLEAMKEALAKKKEEEERMEKEEEERIRQEEERHVQLLEAKRLEEEKKEKQRQKQKDRMKRMKEEGKLLTPKQKLEQKRAQAMLAHLKAQGFAVPGTEGESIPAAPRVERKLKEDKKKKKQEVEAPVEEVKVVEVVKEVIEEATVEKVEEEDDGVADAWDADSDEEETEPSSESVADAKDSKSEDATDEDSDSDESDEKEVRMELSSRERAMERIRLRKVENEKNKNPDLLRAPVVCVLGHVDHGKTKILDKLRKTNVQDGEVGGITQQIGATNVPGDAIRAQTRMIKEFNFDDLSFPGLLIIDTPGHESFSNLRTRGSSLCDIAILVVDITQGLEPQTIESINLLRNRKTPFVVALNKVDRVFEWESHPNEDIKELNKYQTVACKNDFDRRKTEIITALNEQGLNAALLWENPDPRSYVSLIPTSAISGDGMGNLMTLICTMCQKRLIQRLIFTEELQCTVLEVKTIQGHGVTIDVILVNGRLREGDTIILAGTEGPIVTTIRSLLLPKPCKEIRVKGAYDEFKEVQGAQGVKIAAKELEKAIAGLNLMVAHHEDEVELLREMVDKEFRSAMRAMKVKDRGVYVQASTLGALEALLEFFKANSVPYSGIRVGPVVKKDVMKAAAMLEHEPMYAVILAFDVKVERDAQDMADREGVKIFSEETIYHLGDRYVEYIKDFKRRKQEEVKHIAIFPCRLKIIPSAIFNKRDPIVLGVTVDAGIIRMGTALCVPTKEFVDIGIVTSLEFDHKPVEIAKKGVDVCIKVEPVPGHTPKLFGRHFDETDMLVSKISRESINACKDHFRDDLTKTDWKLMAELKKEFSIL